MTRIVEKTNKFFDNLFKKIPGGVFGVLSAVVGVVCDLITVSQFPGYSITTNLASDLGYYKLSPLYYVFNAGLVIAGILGVIFYVSFGRSLKEETIYPKSMKFPIQRF